MDTLILPSVHAMLICLTHMLYKDIISRYVSTAEILSPYGTLSFYVGVIIEYILIPACQEHEDELQT